MVYFTVIRVFHHVNIFSTMCYHMYTTKCHSCQGHGKNVSFKKHITSAINCTSSQLVLKELMYALFDTLNTIISDRATPLRATYNVHINHYYRCSLEDTEKHPTFLKMSTGIMIKQQAIYLSLRALQAAGLFQPLGCLTIGYAVTGKRTSNTIRIFT